MFHVDMIYSQVKIITLHVDIIYLKCVAGGAKDLEGKKKYPPPPKTWRKELPSVLARVNRFPWSRSVMHIRDIHAVDSERRAIMLRA